MEMESSEEHLGVYRKPPSRHSSEVVKPLCRRRSVVKS